MRAFLQLSETERATLLFVFLLALIALFFLVIFRRIRPCSLLARIFPSLLLLLIGLVLIHLLEGDNALYKETLPTIVGRFIGSLPWILHAFLALASGLYCARSFLREKRVTGSEITPNSIREALDNLPSGICFSGASGIPLLTNRQMYRLTEMLAGHLFRNAEEFWQELMEFDSKNGIEYVRGGHSPVLRLQDGSVWRFSRTELTIDGEYFMQTTAANITKLHMLSEELGKSNATLHDQQKRLKRLLAQIVQIKKDEEILASKVKLHDELGRCVLAGRRFLLQEGVDKKIEPVLALWRETVENLEVSLSDSHQTECDPLCQLTDAAAALGCAIEFEGELPESQDAAYLLLSAVREAVTNAVRHAGASRVMVRIHEEEGMLVAQITDDGMSRKSAITEGGGLMNIRRRLERAGGTMDIICKCGVQLHLRLPLTAGGV